MRSTMACNRRAPMLSTFELISSDNSAILKTDSLVNSKFMSSVSISALCCLKMFAFGSVKIRCKSSLVKPFNSTRMGNRPCNSANISLGLFWLNAPDAMNKIWSVETFPYFVETTDPSMIGSKSRCTPSEEASAPCRESELETILSISSMKTIPSDSTAITASFAMASWVSNLSNSASSMTGLHSRTVIFLLFMDGWEPPAPPFLENILSTLMTNSWIGNGPADGSNRTPSGFPPAPSGNSTSINRSSNAPSRYNARNASLVSSDALSPQTKSKILFSIISATLDLNRCLSFVFVNVIALSIKSRII
mmetsp:Transcript_7870/g.26006  ORF Transcript_7870/g.26006 Transcript_7870/m.26006 type:complete len:307 (+) Transcript_7870:1282-2202(+)